MTDPKSTQKTEYQSINSVAVSDDSTVVINLKPGQGYELPMKMAGCAGMMLNPASFARPDLDQTGDGLGPYVVKPGTFKAGQSATLARAPGSWWGDPAIGPIAYPHRASASENPLAALGHHQEDSTHIAEDVVTVGLTYRIARIEGSGFHGREPIDIVNRAEAIPDGAQTVDINLIFDAFAYMFGG